MASDRPREARIDTAPARGMRDILPDEAAVRDRAMATILDVYRRHGFVRIETPAVENLRLLTGGEGGENEKLIYKILKRGDKLTAAQESGDLADLGLRFDLTVPLARYYAQNHAKLPSPLKAIQIGPVWRAERPQHGRYRQFTQCDIDILGVASEVAEIELILATGEALVALGLDGLTVRINDRRVLAAVAEHCGFEAGRFESVFIALDKLDKVGRSGVATELTGAGHPERAVTALLELMDAVAGRGAIDAVHDLARLVGDRAEPVVWDGLTRIMRSVGEQARELAVEFDATLARGMGYYTGPIFEVRYRDSASSIAGGGRYDRMIGKLLGRDVPACGFSIGFERLVGILGERGGSAPTTSVAGQPRRVAVLVDDGTPVGPALAAARALRAAGDWVSLELRRKNVGKQLDDLARHGFDAHATLDTEGRPIVKPLTRRERA